MPKGSKSEPLVLTNHPISCSALGLPGMQQLLGNHLQLGRVCCCVNRTIHPFNFKMLTNCQVDGVLHGNPDFKTSSIWLQWAKRIVSFETKQTTCARPDTFFVTWHDLRRSLRPQQKNLSADPSSSQPSSKGMQPLERALQRRQDARRQHYQTG